MATCASATALPITFGDSAVADFANSREGNAVQPLTVYTNAFAGMAGVTVTQVGVELLGNTNASLSIRMGLYNGTGALLASSAVITLYQAYDQQIVAALTPSVLLAAGTYYVALVATSTLNIATSTVLSPSMAVPSFASGMPASLALTATAASVPLSVFGCAAATHSLCAFVQYYTPYNAINTNTPQSTTWRYQGLVVASSNADGSLQVQSALIHAVILERIASYPYSINGAFTTFTLAAPSKL